MLIKRAFKVLFSTVFVLPLAASIFIGTARLTLAQKRSNSLWDSFLHGVVNEIGQQATEQTIKLFQSGSNNRSGSEISLTLNEATNIIRVYLSAKNKIFKNPYDTNLLKLITTGRKLEKSVGAVSWLRNNDAYYTYSDQSIDVVKHFQSDTNLAVIEVLITEKRNYYVNGKLNSNSSGWDTDTYQYVISKENGQWRIEHAIAL